MGSRSNLIPDCQRILRDCLKKKKKKEFYFRFLPNGKTMRGIYAIRSRVSCSPSFFIRQKKIDYKPNQFLNTLQAGKTCVKCP